MLFSMKQPSVDRQIVDVISQDAQPLTGTATDYDPLLEMIGDAQFVLIGEASHGTHEFYHERAEITKRLIQEKAFTAVAVEADWPNAYRVNRYVRGLSDDAGANEALSNFHDFPTWMWRNTVMLHFVGWLHGYNAEMPGDAFNVGFYGLDLYSMHASIEAVLGYLDKVDPEAAERARTHYSCFDHYTQDTQGYGYAASFGMKEPCEDEVVKQLLDLQNKAGEYMQGDGIHAEDKYFYAEQNARLVLAAEEYYRSMFAGRVSSWNLRDRHMADTLDHLVNHLNRHGGHNKVVVWAHNSHLGDARATEMGRQGEWNVGQLVRERYGKEAFLLGMSTYTGTVTAASDWGNPPRLKQVQPGLPESYEGVFHAVGEVLGTPNFLLHLRGDTPASQALRKDRLERAIGVIYRPESERWSHYFKATLPEQFDAILHFDETRALEPLEVAPHWEQSEVPETFPSGI